MPYDHQVYNGEAAYDLWVWRFEEIKTAVYNSCLYLFLSVHTAVNSTASKSLSFLDNAQVFDLYSRRKTAISRVSYPLSDTIFN